MNLTDIEAVFGTAKYLENGFPAEERPSEWDYVYDRLRGKDWHDLKVDDLDTMGGPLEGIQCLSADAFVYFLPGIMKLVLDDPSTNYCLVDGIVTRFTHPDYLHDARWYQSKARGHKRKREQKQLDRQRERLMREAKADEELTFALLSTGQRQFLARFLHDALQQEPMMCPVPVNSAIHNLELGRIEEYRQDDVSRWGEQMKSKRRP